MTDMWTYTNVTKEKPLTIDDLLEIFVNLEAKLGNLRKCEIWVMPWQETGVCLKIPIKPTRFWPVAHDIRCETIYMISQADFDAHAEIYMSSLIPIYIQGRYRLVNRYKLAETMSPKDFE